MKRFSNCVSWTKGFVGGIIAILFVALIYAFYKSVNDSTFITKLKEAYK